MSPAEIREWRKAADISQDELADRLGMSQAMLSRIEQGTREAPPQFAERLKRVLHDYVEERRSAVVAVTGGAS